jgi:hypothetical protein
LSSVEDDDNYEDKKNEKSFLTDKQKKAVKKLMNKTGDDLKKMIIQGVDRVYTQTAVKEVISTIEENAPRDKKNKKRKKKAASS